MPGLNSVVFMSGLLSPELCSEVRAKAKMPVFLSPRGGSRSPQGPEVRQVARQIGTTLKK